MPFNSPYMAEKFSQGFMSMIQRKIREHALDPSRVVILDVHGKQSVMKRLVAGDIYLDTFPFSGPTSTIEALMLGIPAITKSGETYRSMLTAGLLNEAGLSEFIATSTDDYIERAVGLSKPSARASTINNKSLQSASFFDAARVAVEHDAILSRLKAS